MGGICSEPVDPGQRGQRARHRDPAVAASLPRRYQDPTAALGSRVSGGEHDPDAPWDQDFPRMTEAELQRKREVFWETRVEGAAHMWQALKLSIEAEDEATARVIMESVGLTPLDFASDYVFSYDDRGRRYDIPMYVIHAPRNLITEEAKLEEAKEMAAADAREARRISFRVRLSLPGPDLQVTCKDTTTIGQVKRKLAKMKGIAAERQMVIYQGRGCPDAFSLRALQIVPNTVVQVMIKSAPPVPPSDESELPSAEEHEEEEEKAEPVAAPEPTAGSNTQPEPSSVSAANIAIPPRPEQFASDDASSTSHSPPSLPPTTAVTVAATEPSVVSEAGLDLASIPQVIPASTPRPPVSPDAPTQPMVSVQAV